MNTLETCVKILTLFTDEEPTLQIGAIAEMLDLPRSTTYRYIAALRAHRLVEESPDGKGIRLGSRILELAATMSRKPLRDLAMPYLERVARETGETVVLCALRRHVGVCLEKVDGHHALRVAHELGDTYPLHSAASGKAILAFLEPDVQKEILDDVGLPAFTETTITDPSRLKIDLARVRKLGFAESEGETIKETHGIAVPIFAASGGILASIGVSAPTYRVHGEDRTRLIRILVDAGRKITHELKVVGSR